MKALADYIERLTIPQGRRAGQPFALLPWQRRFLRGAFGQPDDADLSMARGNGKTAFAAALAAAAVDVGGPLVQPMGESVIVASSFEQALIPWRLLLAFLAPSLAKHGKRFRVQDSANRAAVTDRVTGATVRVLGSDYRRLHGLQANVLLLDEISQWPDVDRMLAALETSRGKIPGARALWLGTRPAAPEHPFEKALQGGLGYAQVHAARAEDSPFALATWRRANPSLNAFPDLLAVLRTEAARAKRDPAALASFEALRLNRGVSDVQQSVLLNAATWREIEAVDPERRGPYVLGVDLGTSAAMSAGAAYWPATGALETLAVFPEIPGLPERGLRDGVGGLYVDCFRRGELVLRGARVSDVRGLLHEVLARWGRPAVVVTDRWREPELRQSLESVAFPVADLAVRGMGFMDGAADVRAFVAACLDGKVRPNRSLLLRSAMAEARTVSDAAGNTKLAKGGQGRKLRARDDAAAAAILAVAEGVRRGGAEAPRAAYLGMV